MVGFSSFAIALRLGLPFHLRLMYLNARCQLSLAGVAVSPILGRPVPSTQQVCEPSKRQRASVVSMGRLAGVIAQANVGMDYGESLIVS
jgi:hypothetical protein